MGDIFSWIGNNWEIATILLLSVDKIVALSPSKMDDLLWTMCKKIIKKASGR